MNNGKKKYKIRHQERSTLRMINPDAADIEKLVEKEDAEARIRIFASNALPAIQEGNVEVYNATKKYSRKDEGKVFKKPEDYEHWPAEFPSMLLWGASTKRNDFIAANGTLYSFTQGSRKNPSVRLEVKKHKTSHVNEVL